MTVPLQDDSSADFPDRVDRALEALWRGDAAQFDRLLDSNDSPGPRVGDMFKGAVSERAAAVLGSSQEPGVAGYAIEGRIGHGGMGVVYQARQLSTNRVVALKVVRDAARAEDYHVKLFQREARALARLKHPCIGAIHDAGQTDDGRHFFAMELVHGRPLMEYVRAKELSIRERLELFCKMCGAINYAHQRSVIHRDLKPSNILIDAEGDPKILDFGVARITDADVGMTTAVTVVGNVVGTLPYMSPEQARGTPEEIDLRSDVYSLGVILYELLTGQLPYEVSKGALPEAVRVICEETPRRPSTISRVLRGDVETIVLKALEKEPSRRYQSALALAEDVERYLSDEPILARPPSAAYQFRKLVARHRLPAALVATLFVVLFAFGIGMALLYAKASRAEHERVYSDQVTQGMTDVLLGAVAEVGSLDAVFERAAAEHAHEPRVVAELRELFGRVYLDRGQYEDAERYLRAAVDIRRQFLDHEPERFTAALRALVVLLRRKREYKEAGVLLNQSLAIAHDRWGDKHPELARTITDLGQLRYSEHDFASARQHYLEALEIWGALPSDHELDLARTLRKLGLLYHTIDDYTQSESCYREALEICRRRDETVEWARIGNCLANLLRFKGDLKGAEQMHRDVLCIRRRELGEKHADVGTTLMNLAGLLRQQGKYVEGEALYLEALQIYEGSLGREHKFVAGPLVGLGYLLLEKGDAKGAEPYLRRAAAIRRERLPKGDWRTADVESILGECLTVLRRYEEAGPLVVAAYPVIRDALGDAHDRTRNALRRVIKLYEAWGRSEEATQYRAMLPREDARKP